MASVVVGCKLPHGLKIRLGEVTEEVKTPDPRDRHRVVTSAGKEIILNGSHSSGVIGGYGLTTVEDGDAMEAWLVENSEMAAVKNELIFIEETKDKAAGKAKENKGRKSGFERADYENPMGDGSIKPTKTIEQAKQEAAEQAAAKAA